MDKNLTKQLKRFTALMVGIQFVTVLTIFLVFFGVNYLLKVRLATLAQTEARRAILVGDLRLAITFLDEVRLAEFKLVRYSLTGGEEVFSLPPASIVHEKSRPGLFDIKKSFVLAPADGYDAPLGYLEFVFSVFDGFEYLLLLSAIPILGSIPMAIRFRRALQSRYTAELTAASNAAIAGMTQMLAHDVRKPFSLLRLGLSELKDTQAHADMQNLVERLTPEVDQALVGVEGMISDVLGLGSDSEHLIKEPIDPSRLIHDSVKGVMFRYPEADVQINYELTPGQLVYVDVRKVQRVLTNIIENAIQAMGIKGQMWFKTRDLEGGYVEFCLGNAGSFITTDNLPKVFDTFFTSNKKEGTGLGLAIAKKMVEAHEGKIWCESSKGGDVAKSKVEFYFTLPIFPVAYYRRLMKNVVFLDDNHFMTSGWQSKLSARGVTLRTFNDAPAFERILPDLPKDTLMFIDVNLGALDGRVIAQKAIQMGFLEVWLATSYQVGTFQVPNGIRGVIGKEPPDWITALG